MKAITVYQPWASLIAVGAKKYETRSWATTYRGPIAIHAGKKPLEQILKEMFPLGHWDYHPDYLAKQAFLTDIRRFISTDNNNMPYGSIIVTAELVECWKIVRSNIYGACIIVNRPDKYESRLIREPADELCYGDWTLGRYAWELTNVKMLPEPVTARGQQGLWNWDERGLK